MPHSGQDVPDDPDARLVVLGMDYPYSKEPSSPAELAARAIFESRGNTPRLYRNTLIFLAADKTRLQDLDEAVRKYLAWDSILAEKETPLNLDPQQVKQAEMQKAMADGAVKARLPETYQWLLVPTQKNDPSASVEWQAFRLTGQEALAVRASRKLKNDELMITSFAPSLLRMELDRVPLWRGNHVAVRQVVEDFARYPYLPRLKYPAVLISAIQSGLPLMTWVKDSFAYAESYDEVEQRYRGLRSLQTISLTSDDPQGLLVKPEIAQKQIETERVKPENPSPPEGGENGGGEEGPRPDTGGGSSGRPEEPQKTLPRRFHGTVDLDATRVGRDAGKIAEEVIAHLAGLVGAKVTVTLEISAEVPAGVSEQVVRIVTENSRTLKFISQGFEKE